MMNGYIPINNNIPQINPYQEKMDRYMNLTQQQNNIQPQLSNTNMNFVIVENLQKAKEQIVPYGYTMWMRDASEPYQYIKSVDQVGTPSFKILKVEDVTDTMPKTAVENLQINNNYVQMQDFEKLSLRVEQLQDATNYYNNILNQILVSKEKEEDKEVKKVGRPKVEKVGDTNA